jgi:hypothetical protein
MKHTFVGEWFSIRFLVDDWGRAIVALEVVLRTNATSDFVVTTTVELRGAVGRTEGGARDKAFSRTTRFLNTTSVAQQIG